MKTKVSQPACTQQSCYNAVNIAIAFAHGLHATLNCNCDRIFLTQWLQMPPKRNRQGPAQNKNKKPAFAFSSIKFQDAEKVDDDVLG